MKKILFIIVCILFVFFIYVCNKDDDVLYFCISDNNNTSYNSELTQYLKNKNVFENYILYKNNKNYRVVDLIYDIENNKQIKMDSKVYYIDNLLVRSELTVLNIGHNDLIFNNLDENEIYNYINSIIDDYENLFSLLRKYTKENIILVFDYNIHKKYKEYLYERLEIKTNKYKIKLVKKNKLLEFVKNIY